jgi:hypothetical protein
MHSGNDRRRRPLLDLSNLDTRLGGDLRSARPPARLDPPKPQQRRQLRLITGAAHALEQLG